MKKPISIILAIVLIINAILFAMSKISGLYFWIIIGIIALFAYKILPRLK